MFGAYFPLIDEAVSAAGTALTNYQNMKLSEQQNAAQEALLAQQNDYNSAEAQKQRDWEEQMSNTAYQRARQDMEAAGINPILLGTGAQSASTPTGYAAASSASHARSVPQMVNVIQAGINSGYASNRQFNDNINTVFNALGSLTGGSQRYTSTNIGFGA